MYAENIAEIDKIAKLIYFALVYLTTPGICIPSLLISTINYFIYDLGDESFFLPFRVMYDLKFILKSTAQSTLSLSLSL